MSAAGIHRAVRALAPALAAGITLLAGTSAAAQASETRLMMEVVVWSAVFFVWLFLSLYLLVTRRWLALGIWAIPIAFAWVTFSAEYNWRHRTGALLWLLGWLFLMVPSGPSQRTSGAAAALDPANQEASRTGMVAACQSHEPASEICDCIADKGVARFSAQEIQAFSAAHSQTGAWPDTFIEFVDDASPSCLPTSALEVETPEAPITEPSLEWSTTSADGQAALHQQPGQGNRCLISCEMGGTVLWRESGTCLGTKRDFRFVANDCERGVVVFPVRLNDKNWQSTPVASVYDRAQKAWDVAAATVVRDHAVAASSISWLQGAFGASGAGPRYTDNGAAVALEAIDGTHSEIPLVVKKKPTRKGTLTSKKARPRRR